MIMKSCREVKGREPHISTAYAIAPIPFIQTRRNAPLENLISKWLYPLAVEVNPDFYDVLFKLKMLSQKLEV